MSVRITKKNIRRGVQIFTLISLLSLTAIFFLTRSGSITEAFRMFKPEIFIFVPFLILFDWFGGGFRLYVFSKVLHPRISFKSCVRANLANYFMSSITPAQTGGGPAQIYILYANGMPAVEATSASLMTFLSTVFFLIIMAMVTFMLKGKAPLPGSLLPKLFNYGIFLFLLIGILFLLALFFPNFYKEAVTRIVRLISRIKKKNYISGTQWVNDMIEGVDRTHKYLLFFLKERLWVFLLGVLISAFLFFSKFLMAYVIVRGLGIEVSVVHVVLLQVVIILINYFFPSPGGSGATEFSSAALMAPVVPQTLLMYYVILWRIFTSYIAIGVGGFVIIHEMGKKEKLEIKNGLTSNGAAKEDILLEMDE
ncbi:hypothetical protein DRQ05_03475 [bacterium]|nr:MAG: hypothetical protein DRQ05_03475 [bacterium]